MSIAAPTLRLHLSLAMISAAAVAYQLALMQILAVLQWHHFAYMIIAVALLGFGAAGTCLSLLRERLMQRFSLLLPIVMFLCGAAMAQAPVIAQSSWVRFDSLLLFTGITQFLRLLVAYGLYLLPFFCAGLAVGMIFVHAAGDIDRLYFWNLTGSAAGGATMAGLPWLFMPSVLPGLAALASIAAALLVLPESMRRPPFPQTGIAGASLPASSAGPVTECHSGECDPRPPEGKRAMLWAVALLSALAVLFALIRPPVLVLSQFKDLSKVLLLPDARITNQEKSPFGLLQIVSSPAIRHAPGLSLAYREAVPTVRAVYANGDWFGAIISRHEGDSAAFMDFTTGALPYVMGKRESILILDAGTGALLPQALNSGARQIVAVEPHPAILSLLRKDLPGGASTVYDHPSVSVRCLAPRTFLFVDPSLYDMIILPTLGVFGGNSGMQAIREQYLLTKESFRQMWRKLTPPGVIGITCWMDYPLRNPLKILATFAEALEEEGIRDIRAHLVAVRGWGTVTIAAKKTPVDATETEVIRRFCRRLLFDPLLLPGVSAGERMHHNSLQEMRLFAYVDAILSPERGRVYAEYPFTVRPATDDSPYFSQFLRWRSIPVLAGLYGARAVPFFEIGYLLVLVTLVQVCVAAAVLILLPLRLARREGRYRMSAFLYFGGLGLGYMFVEIVLIQRFLLYFGNPLYAAAAVISGMLAFSGFGSLLAARWIRSRTRALGVVALIVLLILLYAFLLTPALLSTIAMPPALKIVFSVLFIAPAGLVMGMPFPVGVRVLAVTAEKEIAWAWGINGNLAVVGTVLAMVVALEIGFTWVMILAALAYGIAFIGGMTGLFRPEGFRS